MNRTKCAYGRFSGRACVGSSYVSNQSMNVSCFHTLCDNQIISPSSVYSQCVLPEAIQKWLSVCGRECTHFNISLVLYDWVYVGISMYIYYNLNENK